MNALHLWQESLIHLAVKGTALLATALLAGLAVRRLSAARRYWLWLSTVFALLLLTLALPLLPAWRVLPVHAWEPGQLMPREEIAPAPPVTMPAQATAPSPKIEAAPAEQPRTQAPSAPQAEQAAAPLEAGPALSAGEWFSLLWLGGLLLMLARLGLSAWRLRRLGRCTVPVSADLLACLPAAPAKLARQLGLHTTPHILLGPPGSVPMVWGLWKPRLLLPEGFHQWPADKLRAVLLHEFEHLRRRDPLALAAAQLMQALHWFNPLAWLALHRLRAEQEHACDDAALAQGLRPSDYAQHLLDLSRHTRLAPGLGLCALAMARPAPVESRVHANLDPHRPRHASSKNWRRLSLGLALVTALPLAMLHALERAPVRGRILDRNGVVLASSQGPLERVYLLKEIAGHVLGYTRKSQHGHAPASVPAQHGNVGVEKSHDTQLSSGQDVTLTLDQRIQKLTYQALAEAGVTRGAVVIMDPRNGDVLAMVSLPSYDPQAFFPRLSQETWDSLLADRDMPLLDRTTRAFAPGSAYKVSIALAGDLAGIGERRFDCSGSITYGSKTMKCWIHRQNGDAHGLLDLKDALVHSCNCYFYQYGNTAGIDNITKMGKLLGMGERTGIGLPTEDGGILPNPEWLRLHAPKERWTNGHTANTSIGQGMVAVMAHAVTMLRRMPGT
ncbi:MAG: M56 family metallopeptidase, partial [Verrucomicrobiota bacterium]